jgi:hypothetical protein
MFRFTIRDVLWLTVVVALAVGWSLEHYRISRERAALKADRQKLQLTAERLQAMSLENAEVALKIRESELVQCNEIRRRNPGALTDAEFRTAVLLVEKARIDVETARAKQSFGPSP